jgi:hypothetical protein
MQQGRSSDLAKQSARPDPLESWWNFTGNRHTLLALWNSRLHFSGCPGEDKNETWCAQCGILILAAIAAAPLAQQRQSDAAAGRYFPAKASWETRSPAELGFDPVKLDAAIRRLIRENPNQFSFCSNCPYAVRPISSCSLHAYPLHSIQV